MYPTVVSSMQNAAGEPSMTSADVTDTVGGQYDVVVVGAGNAALTAALAAQEQGAKTLVLEKAPADERGGNSRFTGGLFRFAYDGIGEVRELLLDDDTRRVEVGRYAVEDYLQDLVRITAGRVDPDLAKTLVERSLATMQWMRDLGVKWEFTSLFGAMKNDITVYAPGAVLQSKGAGVGLVSYLFRAVESRRIPVAYDQEVVRLAVQDGRVVGVVAREGRRERTIRARAVVLGSGGFEASAEMRRRHLGADWGPVKVRGSRFDTGEGLRAALEAGAQPYGQWEGCHATPIDADAPEVGELSLTDKTNRLSYPFGIMVNTQGRRFTDEGESYASHTYAKTGRAILAQPAARAFQVFDQKTIHLLEPRYSTRKPISADSIEELATALGIPAEPMDETVRSFNSATSARSFDPTTLDGKSTTGITPPKTNWAVPLDAPPFVAYPVACGITFTYGGVRIDGEARVLRDGGKPIDGLFASGEITGGFFFDNYPGGAGLMRGAVFGRLAGTNAAKAAYSARGR